MATLSGKGGKSKGRRQSKSGSAPKRKKDHVHKKSGWVHKKIKTNRGTTVDVKCNWYMQQKIKREICFVEPPNGADEQGGYNRGAIASNEVKGRIDKGPKDKPFKK